jgi:hypothetical protein
MVIGNKVGVSKDSTLIWNATDKNGIVAGSDDPIIESYLTSSISVGPGLAAEGVYPYSLESKDASGNHVTRDIEVVVDTTEPAPSLSFSNSNPQDLRGLATVVLDAGDPNIHSMFLKVGDRTSMNVTGLSQYLLDTTEIPDGNYDLKLVATDIAGNEATVVLPILVANNAPQITAAIIAGLAAGGGIASIVWLVFGRRGTGSANKS